MTRIDKPLKFYGDKGHERTYEHTHEAFERHVLREEPVRSFRLHGNYIDKKYDRGITFHRPGFRTYRPVESARFAYNSAYAYTLTWTPGHMTLVGDLGTMTIVHYHAMPTLEEALDWLTTSDFDYLMGKSGVKQEFDREGTVAHMWTAIMEGVEEHMKNLAEEVSDWQKSKPKWVKSHGMKKADFEQEMDYWKGDDPNINYNFRKVEPPKSYYLPRELWSEEQKLGWHVPDGFEMLFRAWKFLYDESEIFFYPDELTNPERREELKEALEHWCDGRADDEIVGWIIRDMGYDDYYGQHRYNDGYVWKLAAIKLGCQMIREQLAKEAAIPAQDQRSNEVLQQNVRETYEAMCAMRDAINEHIPMPSLESDLLQGPETSVFCATVAEAVINAVTMP